MHIHTSMLTLCSQWEGQEQGCTDACACMVDLHFTWSALEHLVIKATRSIRKRKDEEKRVYNDDMFRLKVQVILCSYLQ